MLQCQNCPSAVSVIERVQVYSLLVLHWHSEMWAKVLLTNECKSLTKTTETQKMQPTLAEFNSGDVYEKHGKLKARTEAVIKANKRVDTLNTEKI